MHLPALVRRLLVGWGALALLCACSDETTDRPDAQQTPLLDVKQGYRLKLRFTGGKADGVHIELDQDLSGDQGKVIFGNTHLEPPAVSFAVQDSVAQAFAGTVQKLDLQFRFGFVVGAKSHPISVGAPGSYPFSCAAPMLQVTFVDGMYRSSCPGMQGSVEVVEFSSAPGGRFRGRVKGRLQHYFFSSQYLDDCNPDGLGVTCKDTASWVDVDGDFGFTLPPLNDDVAP